MNIPLQDFPEQLPLDKTSEAGRMQAAVRKWGREIVLAIRALQNAPTTQTTAAPAAPVTPAPATPTITAPSSVRWGLGIRGSIGDQTDLQAQFRTKEPAFGVPPQDQSIPYFDTDGSRNWFSLAELKALIATSPFIVTVSTNTTLGNSHETVVVSNGSTITLPKASNYKNKRFNVIRSGTSDVIVAVTGTDTISGQSSLTLIVQWASVVLISDGLNWVICS